uniref:Myb/SANT-like domain-containing protein n=1 Tax=Setaria italica TaxID=4555 RepID=K3ZEI1_SETIT
LAYSNYALYNWTQIASSCANWDEATTKTFLDLCIAEKNQLNWSNKCLTKLGWQHVYRNFKQQIYLTLGSKQLQNKLSTMQRAFMTWRDLQVPSGLGLDKHTGGVVADSTFLVADEEETSAGAAQTSTAKPPPFLDELYTLFGHTTQARGTLLTTGGVRQSSRQAPRPMPASSARNMSKRPTWDEVVDSPPKKKSGNLVDYVRELSETVAMRSQKCGSHEQEELDHAMQIIEEDGIEEGSDLYCMTLYLCKNAVYRRAFMKMKTREGRLHWIQFNWERENK